MALEAEASSPTLQAAGTTERASSITSPDHARRMRLIVEIGFIFVLAPLLIRYSIFNWRVPLPLVLQPLLFAVAGYLVWDRTFSVGEEASRLFPMRTLVAILGLFALVTLGMSLYMLSEIPERFLELPRSNLRMWAMIVIFYPLVSVISQEVIYRTFFFHRYGPLFGDARWLAYLVNGTLFGFAHIIFGSYVSIALTTVLGCLLAWRYDETRSFWAVWLEHTLYGCLVFTIGLGHYFFTGIATI